MSYAGDKTPEESWEILSREKDALLVDVRTVPEWQFVGTPDLSSIEKETICVSWQSYPEMDVNPGFIREIENAGADKNRPILFLCRSGVRSRHAATLATEAGFGPCYNVATGFEGNHDQDGHRGNADGWKVAGLPWRQP